METVIRDLCLCDRVGHPDPVYHRPGPGLCRGPGLGPYLCPGLGPFALLPLLHDIKTKISHSRRNVNQFSDKFVQCLCNMP